MSDRWHTFHGTSFCGVPAAQFWAEFLVWEAILNERPDLRGIVELGTWQGGFSLYLAAQARGRGMLFRTYDVQAPDRPVPGFVQLDVYAEAALVVESVRECEPAVVLCDGGNKPRELRTFSRDLGEASVIAVHDWGTECLPADVPDDLEMLFGDWCDEVGSLTRFFHRNGRQ